jgi:maltose O-acetyltransferase
MREQGLRLLLKNRLKKMSPLSLFRLEIEAWLTILIGWIPGNLGFLIRTMFYKGLFQQLKGLSFIQPSVRIVHSHRIQCGKNFAVNSGTYLNAIGGIEFGDNVLIGPNVVISSGEHPTTMSILPILFQDPLPKQIRIGSGVWIAANAVILPGITIGEGSVIAANAVVTKSIGKNEIWGGVPARKILVIVIGIKRVFFLGASEALDFWSSPH